MKATPYALLAALTIPALLRAQSLEHRVNGVRDGLVSFTFAAHEGVCGNGRDFLRDGVSGDGYITSDNFQGYSRGRRWDDECEKGPVRVLVSVSSGGVVRLKTYAGPLMHESDQVRALGDVSASDATAFLRDLAENGTGRVPDEALLPLVLAEGPRPWPLFFRIARSDERPKSLRRNAATWLGRASAATLGVSDRDRSEDDEMRASAVFALSQHRDAAVPELLQVARSSPHPGARAQAMFWLGQTGDPRALDYFSEVLGIR
jgi:HEAT repeat protein